MVFSSIQFLLFFIALILIFSITRKQSAKKLILLVASLFFYSYWDIRFVPLLILLAIFNFIIGLIIDNNIHVIYSRKTTLLIGIIGNLCVLGYFKYTNFLIQNAKLLLSSFGLGISTIKIILPLGISFFIFELISYLVDIYNNKIHSGSFFDFLLFVCFFPRLASGPIIRPSDFLPQLNKEIKINKINLFEGVQIFILGLFKKVILADRIAPFVDAVFAAPSPFSSITIWLAVIAYSIQIYCDFSGYSDMAIGIAKILGFNLPTNFNMPYISKNLTEFWKRWHISLSSWIRDYLYFPLGGNRKGKARAVFNQIFSMLICGLWHGAGWTFVCWGGLHGLGLVIQKNFSKLMQGSSIKINKYFGKALSLVLTYIYVCVCWVFFRANSFKSVLIILQKMFLPSRGVNWIYSPLLPVIIIVLLATAFKYTRKDTNYLILDLSRPIPVFLFVFTTMSIIFLSATNTSPFIYFQF